MPQSLSSVLVHLIFSTKNREPFITPAIEKELHPYIASIFKELKSPSLTLDGTADHLHILFSLGRVIKIADLVERLRPGPPNGLKPKGGTSGFSLAERLWSVLHRSIASAYLRALHCPAEDSPSADPIQGRVPQIS
jgi:hypothetical protein